MSLLGIILPNDATMPKSKLWVTSSGFNGHSLTGIPCACAYLRTAESGSVLLTLTGVQHSSKADTHPPGVSLEKRSASG